MAEVYVQMLILLNSCAHTRRYIIAFVLQIALCVGLARSLCELVGLHPINATVNQTVRIECRSNCTPIRLQYQHDDDSTVPEDIEEAVYPEVEGGTYSGNATIVLTPSFNNTILYCKAFQFDRVEEISIKVQLQDSLESVKNLEDTRNAAHLNLKWDPPPVLDGIQVFYNIKFFHENRTFHVAVNQTHYSVPSLCPPCHTSNFSITPIAGQLRGPTKYIFRPSCTKGYQIDERDYPRTDNKIVISAKIEDIWCSPANATVTTSCQKSQGTDEIFLVSEKNSWKINLPSQDLCNVTVSLQYSGDYTPSPNEPFNINRDTQSVTAEFDRINCTSLCIRCLFASWSEDQISCDADIQFVKNYFGRAPHKSSIDLRRTCFSDLPCNRRYIMNSTVSDGKFALHFALFGGTVNNSASNDNPPAASNVSTNLDYLWFASLILVPVLVLVALGIVWYKWPNKGSAKITDASASDVCIPLEEPLCTTAESPTTAMTSAGQIVVTGNSASTVAGQSAATSTAATSTAGQSAATATAGQSAATATATPTAATAGQSAATATSTAGQSAATATSTAGQSAATATATPTAGTATAGQSAATAGTATAGQSAATATSTATVTAATEQSTTATSSIETDSASGDTGFLTEAETEENDNSNNVIVGLGQLDSMSLGQVLGADRSSASTFERLSNSSIYSSLPGSHVADDIVAMPASEQLDYEVRLRSQAKQ